MNLFKYFFISAVAILAAGCSSAPKKIVFVSGNSVHYWGDHENSILCDILADKTKEAMGDKVIVSHLSTEKGDDLEPLKSADAVIIIGEGEAHHPFKDKMEFLKDLSLRGVSIGVYHYALMLDDNPSDVKILDDVIGGHFEPNWSVNPTFEGKFDLNGDNPICNGVKPFAMYDEWHFNIKFTENSNQKHIDVLTTVPPNNARKRSDGRATGNKFVRANLGRRETILWTVENPNGTRGFGFTGGHYIWSIIQPDYRKLNLNAIAWLAGIEIPKNGFDSTEPSVDEIAVKIKKDKRPDYDNYMENVKKRAAAWGK